MENYSLISNTSGTGDVMHSLYKINLVLTRNDTDVSKHNIKKINLKLW